MTGPFVPAAMLNLIRAVLGIHHHRFMLGKPEPQLDSSGSPAHQPMSTATAIVTATKPAA